MLIEELRELDEQKKSFDIADEAMVKECYDLRQQLKTYTKDMRDVINHPNYSLQFMQSGRLIKVKHQELDFGWGAVVNFTPIKAGKGEKQEDMIPQESYVIDVLLQVADASSSRTKFMGELPQGIRPPAEDEKGRMEVVPVLLSAIDRIGHIRVFLPSDLKSLDQRNTVQKSLEEVKRRFPDGIAVLDPIENMGITDDSFKKLLRVSTPILGHCGHAQETLENRGSRVTTTVQSSVQLATPTRALRPVC